MSDQDILALLKNGHREKAFQKLYQLYPRIEKLILRQGGNKADANDVFQELLLFFTGIFKQQILSLAHHFTPICILYLDLYGLI